MEYLADFFALYGAGITLIALLGIAILGFLKYCNLFQRFAEKKRHYIYLTISVGFSIIATIVYLLIIGQFDFDYILLIASAIYTLNQAFYNIFKVTPVNKLFEKILNFLASKKE